MYLKSSVNITFSVAIRLHQNASNVYILDLINLCFSPTILPKVKENVWNLFSFLSYYFISIFVDFI